MGLFDKKYCDVCGNKIGLLGNRKLEDGNLCKDCAKKLSPWFSERRHSTLSEIKAQLDYREANKAKVAAFYAHKTLGNRTKLMIDRQKRRFMVAKTSNINEENPDVLDFSMARGCETIIDEHRNEKKQRNADGSYVSYHPPRYEYSYTMKVKIFVDNPYFDEISFDISDGYINTGEVSMTGNGNWTVNRVGVGFTDSRNIQKYNECVQLGNEIKAEIDSMQGGGDMGQQGPTAQAMQTAAEVNRMREQAMGNGAMQFGSQQYSAQPAAQPAVNATWTCPFCDTVNNGKFCEGCGAKRP